MAVLAIAAFSIPPAPAAPTDVPALARRFETMEGLRGEIISRLLKKPHIAAANPDPADPAKIHIKIRAADDSLSEGLIFLDNLAGRMKAGDPEAESFEIDRFLAAVVPDATDTSFDPARVYTNIRPRDFLTSTAPSGSGEQSPENIILHDELPGDIIEVYQMDFPDSLSLLTPDLTEGRSADELRVLGLRNLVREMPKLTEEKIAEGVSLYALEDNPGITPGFLLADEFWQKIDEQHPAGAIVAIPRRDQLFVFSKDVVNAKKIARALINATFEDGFDLLSEYIFERRDGKLAVVSE